MLLQWAAIGIPPELTGPMGLDDLSLLDEELTRRAAELVRDELDQFMGQEDYPIAVSVRRFLRLAGADPTTRARLEPALVGFVSEAANSLKALEWARVAGRVVTIAVQGEPAELAGLCDSIAPHRGWLEEYLDLVEQSEPFPDRHESLVFGLATERQIYSRAVRNEMLRGFLEEEGLLPKGDSRELD
ncbi:MAG: hypothetical protein GY929_22235 [Actinomycetia bacterium]|nr:hypothetical protein [Actinomycetes bacterium]